MSAPRIALIDGVLYGADKAVFDFVHERVGAATSGHYTAIGFVSDSRIVAGFVFFNHRAGDDIEVAAAVDEPMFCTPPRIARVLKYPFVQLGLPRVSAEIPLANERSLRVAKALGFIREGVKWKARNGGHVGVFGLRKHHVERFLAR